MSTAARAGNGLLAAAGLPAYTRFRRALREPAAVQRALLRRLVARNASTAFGAAHGFSSIRTIDEYRRRVPLRTYDELQPWLAAVAGGRSHVLTAERVDWLEPSGGSAGPSKLLPYTRGLRDELAAATLPWLVDLYGNRPRVRGGTAYWAISPPTRLPAASPGGVPIGADDDADYFPAFFRGLVARGQAVPTTVAAAGDIHACRRATLEALLDADDLAFISVWSPSFLTLLTDALDACWDGLRSPRLPARPPEDLGRIWPNLELISCWTDGHAGRALAGVRRRFPNVAIQPKGLLATEGVVTIPLHGCPAPVAAVRSHFLEFLADDTATLLHELDVGGTYEVVLSTGGGLYRYRLGDLVRVEGRLHATPLLRFLGRADGRVDLAGEKLSPAFVESALAAAEAASGMAASFALLSPREDGQGYVLTVQLPSPCGATAAAGRLAGALEAQLRTAYHYRLARDLGQLQPVTARSVQGAERAFEAAGLARGQRAGAIKPPVLAARPFEEEMACTPQP